MVIYILYTLSKPSISQAVATYRSSVLLL